MDSHRIHFLLQNQRAWYLELATMLRGLFGLLLWYLGFYLVCAYAWKVPTRPRWTGLSRSVKKLNALLIVSSSLLGGVTGTSASPPTPISSVSSGLLAATPAEGLTTLDKNDEARRLFTKARQCESDGDFVAAQEFYEEVVQVEPDFIYAWANLANVLVQRGNLEQGLLCYKKALSLRPPAGEQLSTILLNTATTEASLGNNVAAVRDMELAEKVSGPTTNIVTNKAVLLTQQNKWQEGCDTFERVFKTSEKDALPWWLRYSMALLETNRALEAVAYMQRVLQRYPYEAECKAFATALYEALGSRQEAARYWKQMSDAEKVMYTDPAFLSDKLKWGPVATKSLLRYTSTNQAR